MCPCCHSKERTRIHGGFKCKECGLSYNDTTEHWVGRDDIPFRSLWDRLSLGVIK